MQEKNVVIFGDSLLRPIIIDNNKYTVSTDIDWTAIEEKLNVRIDNRSRMGATIRHGCSYLTEYLKSREGVYAAVIEYGGNDSDYDWVEVSRDRTKTHLPKTSPDEFAGKLNSMIDILQQRKIKPILMTLPPISSVKYFDWIIGKGLNADNIMHHLKDIEVISRRQESYNNIVMETAIKRNAALADVRQKFLLRNDYISLICEDGIHPNPRGGQLIADTFIEKFAL